MNPDTAEQIAFLERFKADILAHFGGDRSEGTRSRINRGMKRARAIVDETGSMKSVSLSPPPAIGGLLVRNADPFNYILQDYYGMSLTKTVADMIEEAIGVLESPDWERQKKSPLTRRENGAELRQAADAKPPKGAASSTSLKGPELPEKVTISWLVRHVPISFWLWLVGIVGAAFAAGAKIGPMLQ